jgi:hypothetical protein
MWHSLYGLDTVSFVHLHAFSCGVCLYVTYSWISNPSISLYYIGINVIFGVKTLLQANIGQPMSDARFLDFGRHRLAHEHWVILTVVSPISYESWSGSLAD